MTAAEDALWGLQQGGLRLGRYVEEFLELSNKVSWHDAALGACFLLRLDDKMIRCDLPIGDFLLIKLINLILFLNGSDFESRHPAPAGTRRVSPAYPTPRTPTYLSNGSHRLPNSKPPPPPSLPPKQLHPPQPRAAVCSELKPAAVRGSFKAAAVFGGVVGIQP